MRISICLRLLWITLIWIASTFLCQTSGHCAAEPIEELPRDIVKLGTGISRLPVSLYSPDRVSDLIVLTASRLWNFSKPDDRVMPSSDQRPKGLVVRYAF